MNFLIQVHKCKSLWYKCRVWHCGISFIQLLTKISFRFTKNNYDYNEFPWLFETMFKFWIFLNAQKHLSLGVANFKRIRHESHSIAPVVIKYIYSNKIIFFSLYWNNKLLPKTFKCIVFIIHANP